MLTRSIRNRINSRDGKQICACWCIALVCVCVRFSVLYISMCARVSMHGLTTRGCSHVTAISCCTWYCVRVVPTVHTGTPSIGIVQLRPGGLNPLHVATQEYKKPSIIMYAPSAKFCPRKKINYGHFRFPKNLNCCGPYCAVSRV